MCVCGGVLDLQGLSLNVTVDGELLLPNAHFTSVLFLKYTDCELVCYSLKLLFSRRGIELFVLQKQWKSVAIVMGEKFILHLF